MPDNNFNPLLHWTEVLRDADGEPAPDPGTSPWRQAGDDDGRAAAPKPLYKRRRHERRRTGPPDKLEWED